MTGEAPAIAGTLLRAGRREVETRHGPFTVHVCQDLTRRTYVLAITRGDVAAPEPLLARVHSSCVTSETYGGCDCDCSEQLDAALAAIAAAGRGIVFYLDQEGRGAGFVAKVRDRMLVQASRGTVGTFEAYARMGLAADLRSYEAVAAARTLLGIAAPLRLLTNNPEKLATLAALAVPLAGTVPIAPPPSAFNRHYLAAKAEAGHRLEAGAGPEAEPPGAVTAVEPAAVADTPHLVRIGGYWLPVRARRGADPAPHWFRLHAYADLLRGRERVVLTYGEPHADGVPVLVRLQREALLERLPGPRPGPEARRWAATVAAFVAHGAGIAVMQADESCVTVLAAATAAASDEAMAAAVSPAAIAAASAHTAAADATPAPGPAAARVDAGSQAGAASDAIAAVDAAAVALVRHHVAGRRAVPLVDGERGADAWLRTLAAAGVALDRARPLAEPAARAADRDG